MYTGFHPICVHECIFDFSVRRSVISSQQHSFAAHARCARATAAGLGRHDVGRSWTEGAGHRGGAGARLWGRNGEESASVIELSGVIKWFDVSKGYGFIIPDNGMADVLLHVTCLRRDGYQVAYEGARVLVEALQRPRGLQAFRILSMDESTAIHPAQMPPPRTHVTVAPTSGLERARSSGSIGCAASVF